MADVISMEQLSEIDQRILSELEEAGEESVLTLANTVLSGDDHRITLNEFTNSLKNLVQWEFVKIAISRNQHRRLDGLPIALSLSEIDAIGTFLVFDDGQSRWQDKRRSDPPFGPELPCVIDTPRGKRMGFAVLDKRGYQWWRAKR